MAFTDSQKKALTSKLHQRHVRTRTVGSITLNYVSGWHAIEEANRIFGYDAWDRQTIETNCVWTEQRQGQFGCLYVAKVRVSVRAGSAVIVREGMGTGYGRRDSESAAHEIALKAAETDATKRALTTFGNPFGLKLYDKSYQSRRLSKVEATARNGSEKQTAAPEFALRFIDGHTEHYRSATALAAAFLATIPTLCTLKDVYSFWERNLEALVTLRRRSQGDDPTFDILSRLKARGREVANRPAEAPAANSKEPKGSERQSEPSHVETDQRRGRPSPKERRARDKQHLRFVARHPCLVCGRTPAQAHHLRFAQPRAMSLKVSDEYTVPLCTGHHDALHKTGDEPAWWARHGLDPLAVAERLWKTEDKSDTAELDPLIAARHRTNGSQVEIKPEPRSDERN